MSEEEAYESIIQIEDDVLFTNDFSTRDPEIVNYFKDLPEEKRESQFETALKVGVISLKTIG